MTIGEKIDELNRRMFGLEGRMTQQEEIIKSDREYRKEVHKAILDSIAELKASNRKIEIKLAWYAGALAVLGLVVKFVFKA